MWPKLMTEDFKSQHPDKRYNAAALVWTADKFDGRRMDGISPAYPVSYPPEGGLRIHYDRPLGG